MINLYYTHRGLNSKPFAIKDVLCLERIDNLGAYSIPSGDRPSHPIC